MVGLADRVVVLDDGRVIQDATPNQLRRHPRSSHAAALVGRNVLRGERRGATIRLAEGIETAGPAGQAVGEDGAVDVVCSPAAVQITSRHLPRPPGAWASTVIGIESVGDHARAHLGAPLPMLGRLPLDALDDGLALDSAVWVRLDPDQHRGVPGCSVIRRWRRSDRAATPGLRLTTTDYSTGRRRRRSIQSTYGAALADGVRRLQAAMILAADDDRSSLRSSVAAVNSASAARISSSVAPSATICMTSL